MFVKYSLALLAACLIVQPVFADEDMSSDSKPCVTIVKACLDAGFTHQKIDGKQFWNDCMRPLVLGKQVAGITIDANEVKACRAAKISELEQELNELKAVK